MTDTSCFAPDIQLVCDFKLNRQIAPQCEAFFAGLSDIIDPKCEAFWCSRTTSGRILMISLLVAGLRMFDQQELQTLIGGAESPIDVEDLEKNTVMHDGDDPLYKTFWKVVRSLTQEELRSLLKFVTSTPNPPLLGFKYLNPQFGIRLNPEGHDITRLPTAGMFRRVPSAIKAIS
jgi:ubiquitin-protein ligase E3 C